MGRILKILNQLGVQQKIGSEAEHVTMMKSLESDCANICGVDFVPTISQTKWDF